LCRRGTAAQYRSGNDTSEHINETGFSPELSASEVHGGVELCVSAGTRNKIKIGIK